MANMFESIGEFLAAQLIGQDPATGEIPSQTTSNLIESSGVSGQAEDVLSDVLKQIQFTETRPMFFDLIRRIESDNRKMANPGTTTAKGVYQFTDASVKTAKNRAINLGFDKGVINLIPNNPQQWTDDEADMLTAANMFAQNKVKPGFVDELMVDALSGDRQAMQDAYYMLHHTDPDDATKKRVDKFMPLIGPLMKENFPDTK
jgi:hypothetical protein